MGLRAQAHELEVDIGDAFGLEAILPDDATSWNSAPLRPKEVAFRGNLLIWYRWKLTRFEWDLFQILFAKEKPAPLDLWTAANKLAESLVRWYAELPDSLQYRPSMPAPLYEFHAHYFCVHMILHCQAYEMLFGSAINRVNHYVGDSVSPDVKQQLSEHRLEYAFKAAYLSRDFGNEYGWKIAPPHIFQQATNAVFVFLQDIQDRASHGIQSEASMVDVERGFEECFRCLLGCGMQQMLPRGIARMIYHTATKLRLKLPDLVQRVLQIVADTAWHPSDLRFLNSIFPNPIIARSRKVSQNESRMGSLLNEWENGSR